MAASLTKLFSSDILGAISFNVDVAWVTNYFLFMATIGSAVTPKNKPMRRPRAFTFLLSAAGFAIAWTGTCIPALAASGKAALPEVTSLPGKPTLFADGPDFAGLNYVMEEFIVAGTARSYREIVPPDDQGRWRIKPAKTAPYTTRIVVVRPANPREFNGRVVVEWLNASAGMDYCADWAYMHRELLRSGSAYVAVSAQRVGIDGGMSFFMGQPLKKEDPKRYGRLSHPGDAFSYDMFSQAGRLVKARNRSGVLGPLVARRVIGVGESQSAAFLTTYVNAVDPTDQVFDGYLIHSGAASSAPMDGSSIFWQASQRVVKMRNDLRIPTLIFLTESDVIGIANLKPGFFSARQPDTDRLRVWEVAGTAHADSYLLKVAAIDTGAATPEALAAAYEPTNTISGMPIKLPKSYNLKLPNSYNNGPQQHYVLEAAISHLDHWIATGEQPPKSTPVELAGSGKTGDPIRPVVDANGNLKGGIRSPWVDVPTSRLSGLGSGANAFFNLAGSVDPFDAPTLAKLYPGGKAEYLRKFQAALDSAIRAGFILVADKQEIMAIAALCYHGS